MAKAVKLNGKYQLEPNPALAARVLAGQDLETPGKKLEEEELKELLKRILLRLQALENR